MIDDMKPGSVVVDLAAEAGGNIETIVPGITHFCVPFGYPIIVPFVSHFRRDFRIQRCDTYRFDGFTIPITNSIFDLIRQQHFQIDVIYEWYQGSLSLRFY